MPWRERIADQLRRFDGPQSPGIAKELLGYFNRDLTVLRSFFGSKRTVEGFIPAVYPTLDVSRFISTRNERRIVQGTLANNTAALTTVTSTLVVPNDEVWEVERIMCSSSGNPTAGQVLINLGIRHPLPAGGSLPFFYDRIVKTAASANVTDFLGVEFTTPLVLNGGDVIVGDNRTNGTFTGAVNVTVGAAYRVMPTLA